MQSLFWSIFGLIALYVTNVEPDHKFTEFVGITMFGTYNIISVVVLLNMLIAMMNNSYQHIADHADIEWKFARTKLWMSYFEEGGTLPSPFNIIPSPKSVIHLVKWINKHVLNKSSRQRLTTFETLGRQAAENVQLNHKYQEVLKNLVKRYVAAKIKDAKKGEGLTEENFKELKQDISSFRYEVMGMMKGKYHHHPSGTNSTLAYPGNSFKYSPKFFADDSHLKPEDFKINTDCLLPSPEATVRVLLSPRPCHRERPKDKGVSQRRASDRAEEAGSPGGGRKKEPEVGKVVKKVVQQLERMNRKSKPGPGQPSKARK